MALIHLPEGSISLKGSPGPLIEMSAVMKMMAMSNPLLGEEGGGGEEEVVVFTIPKEGLMRTMKMIISVIDDRERWLYLSTIIMTAHGKSPAAGRQHIFASLDAGGLAFLDGFMNQHMLGAEDIIDLLRGMSYLSIEGPLGDVVKRFILIMFTDWIKSDYRLAMETLRPIVLTHAPPAEHTKLRAYFLLVSDYTAQ
jgi:hypothetical protein